MKKLILPLLGVLLTAACTPSVKDHVPSANITDHSQDPSGSPSGTPSEDPSQEPVQGAFKGWKCLSYSFGKHTSDQTMEFIYDSKGRVCEYDERHIIYENEVPLFDDNYKRIYHYTSDTHIDYYNDFIEGHNPATWYDLDADGRFKEEKNSYGPNYIYSYDEKGHLVEIANRYQYEDEEDEEKYGSWNKSIRIDWDSEGNPTRLYQRWENPLDNQVVERSGIRFVVDRAYFNPFYDMIQDPSVSGTELYSIIGLTGTHAAKLIKGWYSEDDRAVRTDVKLQFDNDRGISGITLEGKNNGLDTKMEYVFSWAIDAPHLEADPNQVIN